VREPVNHRRLRPPQATRRHRRRGRGRAKAIASMSLGAAPASTKSSSTSFNSFAPNWPTSARPCTACSATSSRTSSTATTRRWSVGQGRGRPPLHRRADWMACTESGAARGATGRGQGDVRPDERQPGQHSEGGPAKRVSSKRLQASAPLRPPRGGAVARLGLAHHLSRRFNRTTTNDEGFSRSLGTFRPAGSLAGRLRVYG
jgi:hypothetical protein